MPIAAFAYDYALMAHYAAADAADAMPLLLL